MKIFFACLMALWFGSYFMWSNGEITERNNQIKDLQEEVDFLLISIDVEKSESASHEHYIENLVSKLDRLKNAGLNGTMALSAITQELGEIRGELNAGRPAARTTLIFWIDDVFEMSVDATRDMDRVFTQPKRTATE